MRVNYRKAKDLFCSKYAFYKHTRLSVSKNKKIRKKFIYKKSRKDSVASDGQKGERV